MPAPEDSDLTSHLGEGARLGPYEVVAPLGTGGMGVVYRAHDSRLDREVAVKLLLPELASNPDRRRRFEQEAKSASALNHPNIVTIYDIGTSESTLYIAMELVEGRTLRELLEGEPLPLKRLLDLAVQAASGLAKAHEAGIVHRDLKPENLMVSRDGFVKILDFGLAKLVEHQLQQDSGIATAVGATLPGTVLGTAMYMSPEQASGRSVDYRSDQFSLGVILYEMATGQRPFAKSTTAETMTAIIREEPAPIPHHEDRVPGPLRWLIERCLAKDPSERYASTLDLVRELESLKRHLPELTRSGEMAAITETGASTQAHPTFHRLSFRRGSILSARFAPDGQTVIYGASWDGEPCRLFSTRPESPESSPLMLPEAEILAISSTGQLALSLNRRWAGRFIWSGTLAQAPIMGGAPREILEDVQWADWDPSGQHLAIVRNVSGKTRLEFPIGTTLFETAGWISHPRVSPSGERIAFLHHPMLGDDSGSVVSVDREGNAETHSEGWITAYGLAWHNADEIWFTATKSGVARSIWSVTLSGEQKLLTRTTAELTIQDVAPDGRTLMTSDNGQVGLIGVPAGEEEERDLSLLDWSLVRDISSDGKLLLFDETGEGGGEHHAVYVRRMDGSPAVKLGNGLATALSPDGRWAMSSTATSPRRLMLLPVRAGEIRVVETGVLNCHQFHRFMPNGESLVVAANEPDGGLRLFLIPLDGSAEPRAITPEGISPGFFPMSPDGKWVVAQTADDSFRLFSTEGDESKALPGLGEDDRPVRWSADGESLFGYRRGELPGKIFRLDLASGEQETFKELRPQDPAGVVEIVSIQLTPDGSSYAYSYHRILSDLFLVDGLV